MKALLNSFIICAMLTGSVSLVRSQEKGLSVIHTTMQSGLHLGLTVPPLIGLAATNSESGKAWPIYGLVGGILMAIGDSYSIHVYNQQYEDWLQVHIEKEFTDGQIAYSSVMLTLDVVQIGWSVYRSVRSFMAKPPSSFRLLNRCTDVKKLSL